MGGSCAALHEPGRRTRIGTSRIRGYANRESLARTAALSKTRLPETPRVIRETGPRAAAGGAVRDLCRFPDRPLPPDADQARRVVHLPRDREHRAAISARDWRGLSDD